MKRKSIYISLAVIAVIIGLIIALVIRHDRAQEISMVAKAVPVTISDVRQGEFTDQLSAVGTLKARETILLSAKIPGSVSEVPVEIGDNVQTGKVLMRLDRTNYELVVKQAEAALAAADAAVPQAKAQYEPAEKAYRRATDLFKEGVIPKSRFEAAEAAFKTASAAVSLVGAQRDQAKAALDSAREHLKDTEIRSPISGTVVDKNVEVGQAIAPGVILFRIVDQKRLKADIDLPEADLRRIAIGTSAVVRVESFSKETFSGKVVVLNPMVDRLTRTFRIRIEVPNPQGKLVDGMFARVTMPLGKRRSLAVPYDALQRLPGSGTSYVYIVEKNTAVKKQVQIGAIEGQQAEIRSGLSGGEKVITSISGQLRGGVAVFASESVTKKNQAGVP